MKNTVLDADWTSAEREIAERNWAAMDYSGRCKEKRRRFSRRMTALVQRCLAVSIGVFLWACVLALLIGGK